jgi:hypothetical protein
MTISIFLVLVSLCVALDQPVPPNSVHISVYNDDRTNQLVYVVTWVTANDGPSVLQFGYQSNTYTRTVNSTIPNTHYDSRGGFNHFAVFPLDVVVGGVLYYRVGGVAGLWSNEFALRTVPTSLTSFRAWVTGTNLLQCCCLPMLTYFSRLWCCQ